MPIHPRPPGSNPSVDILPVVWKTIADFNMIAPHDSVLVGVSGGMDSVLLLHLLVKMAPDFSVRLGVAHFNHGLRGREADTDAEFTASLAARLQLPFHGDKQDTRSYRQRHRFSLEEAARRLRYTFFETVCADHGYKKVALGHHADDNAEQILMQLFRGAGMASLAGIPPVRDTNIIRPLIRLTRQQISDYCRSAGISYVTDPSNYDRQHLRNRIRHELIPILRKEYNPAVVQSLNRLSEIVREELQWTEDLSLAQFRLAVTGMKSGRLHLSLNELRHCQPALLRRIFRKAIELVKGDLRRVGFGHIDAVVQLVTAGSGDGSVHLPDRVEVRAVGPELIVTKHAVDLRKACRPAAAPHQYCYNVRPPSATPLSVMVPEAGVRVVFSHFTTGAYGDLDGAGQQQAFFDMDKLHFPLVLRNTRPGDRLSPLGVEGTQKVKKYFIDHKVPKKDRARCPLLVSGEQIVWIVGHRIAEPFKVTSATQRVLKGEVQVV